MRMAKSIRAIALVAVMTLAVAACAEEEGASDDAPKVAALFTQFVDQGNWDPAGYQAYDAMCNKYAFECTYTEEASYEAAPALLRGYAEDGYSMIITHSSGYSAAIEEIAPDYPDTEFVLFSYALDTKGLGNYTAWSVDWGQSGYLNAAVAAYASPTDKIGVVVGEDIPSMEFALNVVKQAVADLAPGKTVEVVYVGSWTDAAKAKELTLRLINEGAGFIIPMADTASTGAKQAAEESGVLTIGEYIDEGHLFPDAIVTSTIVDMDSAYDDIGQNYVAGTLDGQIVQLDASTGTLKYTRPFKLVDPGVEERVDEVSAGLADGSIVVSG